MNKKFYLYCIASFFCLQNNHASGDPWLQSVPLPSSMTASSSIDPESVKVIANTKGDAVIFWVGYNQATPPVRCIFYQNFAGDSPVGEPKSIPYTASYKTGQQDPQFIPADPSTPFNQTAPSGYDADIDEEGNIAIIYLDTGSTFPIQQGTVSTFVTCIFIPKGNAPVVAHTLEYLGAYTAGPLQASVSLNAVGNGTATWKAPWPLEFSGPQGTFHRGIQSLELFGGAWKVTTDDLGNVVADQKKINPLFYSQADSVYFNAASLIQNEGRTIAVWKDVKPSNSSLETVFFNTMDAPDLQESILQINTSLDPQDPPDIRLGLLPKLGMNETSAMAVWVKSSVDHSSGLSSPQVYYSKAPLAANVWSEPASVVQAPSSSTQVSGDTPRIDPLFVDLPESDGHPQDQQYYPLARSDVAKFGEVEMSSLNSKGCAAVVWGNNSTPIPVPTSSDYLLFQPVPQPAFPPLSVVNPLSNYTPTQAPDTLYAGYFDGTNWQSTPIFQNGLPQYYSVKITESGESLAIWNNGADNSIYYSSGFSDGVWTQSAKISPSDASSSTDTAPSLAITQDGCALAAWYEPNGSVPSISYAIYNGKPNPPINGHIFNRKIERFATQEEISYSFSWEASPTPTVVSYAIYTDAALTRRIGSVSKTQTLRFIAHRGSSSIYFVTAVDRNGKESDPLVIDNAL